MLNVQRHSIKAISAPFESRKGILTLELVVHCLLGTLVEVERHGHLLKDER